jgi:Amt family ammonium transporter
MNQVYLLLIKTKFIMKNLFLSIAAIAMVALFSNSVMAQTTASVSNNAKCSIIAPIGITAGADCVSVKAAIAIGLICGAVAVLSVMMFDHLRLDDPVGATSVHLVCGILGTLFVGIFSAEYSLKIQALGVLSYGVVCFPIALLMFFALKKTIGIRVSEEEELKGLDIGEHGQEAYAGFQFFTNS